MQGDTDILIASADTALATAMELVLTHDAQQVARVSSGPQALSHVKALQPKLVILDTNLPDMSGFEVCQRLRLDPSSEQLPIVMISHDDTQVALRKLRALGASAVASPPLTAQDILGFKTLFTTEAYDET